MLKLRLSILIILSILQIINVYSQENKFERKINWKPKQVFYDPNNTEDQQKRKYLLYFENAVYETNLHNLPIYSENIDINGNYSAIAENQVFQSLNDKDTKDVVDLTQIKDNIEIETKINFARKKSFLTIKLVPLRKNKITGVYEKLVSFTLKLIEQSQKSVTKKQKKANTNQSILSSGKWLKIKINKSGIYKLSYDELAALGIANPENARIFGNGGKMLPYYNIDDRPDDLIENKIWKSNSTIYFYGDGPVQWKYDGFSGLFKHEMHQYSDFAYYFISSDANSQTNNLIQTENQSTKTVTHNINSFSDYAYHDIDSINLIHSGRLWVAEHFDFQTDYDFKFNFPNLVSGSTITAETSLLARSPVSSSFTISLNNQSFPSVFSLVSYDYTAIYATQKIDEFSVNSAGSDEVDLKISYNKYTASSEGWLDFITINAKRQLVFTGNQMRFRNTESVGIGNVGQFTISNTDGTTRIWDITNPQKPRIINANQSGTSLNFKLETDSLREFILFNENSAFSPITQGDDVGMIENQNLHGIAATDMIIVCPPEFYEYANTLKEIHQSYDNLNVQVVTTGQVYNEFSSGAHDVSAIRDFMKMLYDRGNLSTNIPKYLCLFGDGSYDNRHNFTENTNYILTYQSENSLSPTLSFVTDDFYGLLDDNEGGSDGYMDVGIGRLPVKNTTEANDAIQKIKDYLNIESYGDWRNRVCFIADDEDDTLHIRQADELSRIVKNNYPVFNIEKIYLDAYVQESSSVGQRYPEVNLAIDNQIAKGLLVMNYTGHGNENGLAEERVVGIDQIKKWSNASKLPIFMTATCEFSRFDDYRKVTAGEHIFLNPNGGAVGLFTTTRLVYASPNFQLNKSFYNFIFENDPISNKRYCLGDVMRLTKNNSGNGINTRNFTLLGDPALQLSYARLFVKTNLINNKPVNGAADTLKAFQKVTIGGEVQTVDGQKLNGYNGIVYPIVYDKTLNVKTLNNDGDGVFNYSIRNSQLFKGKASVKDGDFQFSFIVPKDIRYNVDTGKISYYTSNNQIIEDSKGYFTNVFIGGLATNQSSDLEGPKIRLYLNDENFVNGGITDQSPKLLVYLNDESGINTTGNGIGHDILATVDKKADLQFKLNDYYESDIDDYTSGQVKYSLPKLEPGEHQLHIKAWDVYNNSREDSITFIVTNSEQFKLSHVLNYPNPFSTNTSFFFEHNRPNEMLEVYVHVFTVSGKIVKTIHQEILTTGFRSEGIAWDGRDDFGNKIGRGAYFYKLAVRTSTGEKAEKIEKLLILN